SHRTRHRHWPCSRRGAAAQERGSYERLPALERADLIHPQLVAAAFEACGQPHLQDALGQIWGDHLRPHHKDVGIVVGPRDLGGEHAVAERGAHPGNLVGRYLFTTATAAEDHAEVVGALDHSEPDVGAQRWVVRDLTGVVDSAIVD